MFGKTTPAIFVLLAFLTLFAAPASADNVYTANLGSNTITDVATKGKGSGTVALLCAPMDVQVGPAIGYASCPNANSIAIFDPATNGPRPGISGVQSPAKMAVCMGGTKLAVANN